MAAAGPGVKVYLATQPCDMRKGMDGLAAQVQNVLTANPFSGALFVFRGKRGDILKILTWDGSGLCLFAKRLEQGKFVWPPIVAGRLQLTPAQLALLVEGIDWQRTITGAGQATRSRLTS
jgi:transposase